MFDNTKLALKAIVTDVKNLAKDVVVTLPKGVATDVRQHLEVKREFNEWRKARNASTSNPEDAQ